jgi:hypothetical protein
MQVYADFSLRNANFTLNSVPIKYAQYTAPFTCLPVVQYVTFKLMFDKECAQMRITLLS